MRTSDHQCRSGVQPRMKAARTDADPASPDHPCGSGFQPRPKRTQRGALRGLKIVVMTMAGLAFVVIGLPLGIGMMLPVAHQATADRVFDVPPEELWALISDPAACAAWPGRGVQKVEIETRDGAGVALTWREFYNDGSDLGFERTRMEAPRFFISRIADEGLPYGGTWTFMLDPLEDGGTRVSITEDGEIYSAYFRFVGKYVIGHDATMNTYLDALQRYLRELGEAEAGG